MESRRIVILTGAGIAKESGLDTFRDQDGLWARVRIEDVATPAAFARDPDRVHAFYNHRLEALVSEHVAPNAAHLALARLEAERRGEAPPVTPTVPGQPDADGPATLHPQHTHPLNAPRPARAAPSPRRP